MTVVKYSRCFLSEAENLVLALIARIYKTVSKPLVGSKLLYTCITKTRLVALGKITVFSYLNARN